MIVKTLSRRSGSTSQLLHYILRYVLEKEWKEKEATQKQPKERPLVIRHNLRSRSISGYAKEFENLELLRQHKRTNSVSVYHHILSFSSRDRALITDALLKDIAAKFIELRGVDNLYVGSLHRDKQHVHLHIAMSAVDVAGRSARISKAQFLALKKELDSYQKERYPELAHSLPEHGKKSKEAAQHSIAEAIRSHRASEKASLLETLGASFAKAHSTDDFLRELSGQGYTPYYRSGALTGITTESGRKYRLARLGYDTKKLGELSRIGEEAEQLEELRALRGRATRDRTFIQPAERTSEEQAPEAESKELEEIQSLRDSRNESQQKEDTREEDEPAKEDNERDEDAGRGTSSEDGRER